MEEMENEIGNISNEKKKWLKEIGAAAFYEPIKYAYGFKGYNGTFNLSEEYLKSHTLEELREQYEKNKTHVAQIIANEI